MIGIRLMGGLGNQMFQYAAGKCLALLNRTELGLDLSFYATQPAKSPQFTPRQFELDALSIKAKILRSPVTPNIFLHHYNEYPNQFDPSFTRCPDQTLLEGYFQSEKYFLHAAIDIKSEFRLSLELNPHYAAYRERILRTQEPVSIHIRRGDYLTVGDGNFHPVCDFSYYESAISRLRPHLNKPVFFIFSDDAEWIRNNFKIPYSFVIIDSSYANHSALDMHLMSLCHHHIIANSSYSWWGAWLADYPGKRVIGPYQWFGDFQKNSQTVDLFPPDWMRIIPDNRNLNLISAYINA